MPPTLSNEELLARLVSFDTTSHRSNLPLVDFLANYLDRPGIRIIRHSAPEPDSVKANLVVEVGPATDPSTRRGLVLSGHTDVVPALEPDWKSDPFELTEREGNLYGRGSSDMKGFLAVASNLALGLDRSRLTAPLVLIFTYDEEVGTLGARHFRNSWSLADHPLPRHAIIGEPTELTVIKVHKGHIKLEVTLTGESAHSAYPHLGTNAIEPAGALINALSDLREELQNERLESSVWFPEVPFPSLNVATIEGGSAINIVPDSCRLGFGIRTLPGLDTDALLQRVRKTVDLALGDFPHRTDVLSMSPPMELDAHSRLYEDLTAIACPVQTAGDSQPPAVSFATDAGWFQELEMECVLYGPGSIKVAHKPNEFLPKKDLPIAAAALQDFVARPEGIVR